MRHNSVPFKVLKQMFQKAEVHLSRGKEAIVTAPGANAFPERYVESEGGLCCLNQIFKTLRSVLRIQQ